MKQTLPNSKTVLLLGILSIPLCCCYGVVGLALGIVALVLAKKATELHLENPDDYTGIKNVRNGQVLAIIGVILNILFFLLVIIITFFVADETVFELQKQLEELRTTQQ
jgi:uncharacterized membrane protein